MYFLIVGVSMANSINTNEYEGACEPIANFVGPFLHTDSYYACGYDFSEFFLYACGAWLLVFVFRYLGLSKKSPLAWSVIALFSLLNLLALLSFFADLK